MIGFNRKYCEVVTEVPVTDQSWREIVLETGALQTALQDIKVPKNAGGFMYQNNASESQRFIYWRANQDILELSEQSLDVNLRQNNLRYKFTTTPILSVSISETVNSVVILVATITSVHRFEYSHPNSKSGSGKAGNVSIFADADSTPCHYHIISQLQAPHTAACYLSAADNTAYFALAFPTNTLVYSMTGNGMTNAVELKTASGQMIPRIFTNLTGVLRGSGKSSSGDNNAGTSVVFDQIDNQVLVYILHRDCNVRMYSVGNGHCLASLNVLSENEEKLAVQKNLLRKAPNGNLCVFLCYSKFSEFRLLIPLGSNGDSSGYSITLAKIIPMPQYDVIDFQLTVDRIWALWCNTEGESNISTFPINIESMTSWMTCELLSGQQSYIKELTAMDPKQVFTYYIFHSGRFQTFTIFKALMVCSRNANFFNVIPYLPMNELKERVLAALDADIQNEIMVNNLSTKDYVEIAHRLWEKFYFCCEQYHLEANQPLGIFALEPINIVSVIKQNVISFLRPCENLENALLTGALPLAHDTPTNQEMDLSNLADILSYIEKILPDSVKIEFDKQLFRGDNPLTVVSGLINQLPEDHNLLDRCQTISDIQAVVNIFLEFLSFKKTGPQFHGNKFAMDEDEPSSVAPFSSVIGSSLVSESVRQVALVRYSLCRNLLFLEQLLILNPETMEVNTTEMIRSSCMPETAIFLQSWIVIVWISEPSTITSQLRTGAPSPMPLLKYFIRDKGLKLALDIVESITENVEVNHVVDAILMLLWPVSGGFEFGEWLSETNQHTLIEEYVRLLESWCEWNSCSRQFILALTYLHNGLSSRALDLFLEAAKGVLTEPYLTHYILQQSSSSSSNASLAQYYLKVIKLFEKYSLYDCVISVAQVASRATDKPNHHAMFQSILFNNYMYLNHYEEAYHTLINNCEPERKKDCLRQLICALIGQKRFDILLQLPLVGLEDDVQNIIETRARSMPMQVDHHRGLTAATHYDFLYSFHVRKENMRKAAATMYEKAMRCTQLPVLSQSLEQRYDSLLACINALSLVEKDYAFIAKPVIDEYFDTNNVKDLREVVVVDLDDLQKELLITEAMMIVEKYKENVKSLVSTGPKELVELLNSEKCYTNALKLAKGLNLDLSPIFESLTLACIQASEQPELTPRAGDWLNRNVLTSVPLGRGDDSSTAWNLLQMMFEEEVTDHPELFKAVSRQLLLNKSFLPLWLYNQYKVHNYSELLHLYIQYGRLDEAFDVAFDCLDKLIRRQKFGLNKPEFSNLYFPINNIDLLLYCAQKYCANDDEIQKKTTKLQKMIGSYVAVEG